MEPGQAKRRIAVKEAEEEEAKYTRVDAFNPVESTMLKRGISPRGKKMAKAKVALG